MNRANKILLNPLIFLLLLFVVISSQNAFAQMQRVSTNSNGAQADRGSYQAAISDDGRYIAFRSNATNLVADDTNDVSDIFVRDIQSGSIERVSVDSEGAQFNGGSFAPSLSGDGRFVAFQTNHSFTGSTYAGWDYTKIIVYDRQTQTSIHVLPINGRDPLDRYARLEPAISGNGRFVAFHTYVNPSTSLPLSTRPPADDYNRAVDIYVYDLHAQTTERVSRNSSGAEGNGDSFSASLSDDGNLVAFYSYASNLVMNDTNDAEDIFIKNRATGVTTRASVATDGSQADDDSYEPCLSGNGRFVVFRSRAGNLVPGDTNAAWDIFVRDLQAGTTQRVSVATDGSQANDDSYAPSISGDGRYVAFRSNASNLVANDTNNRWDIFVHDRQTGVTRRINLSGLGAEADIHSYSPVISGDGKSVAFESDATDLIEADTNGSRDIFAVDLQ